VVAAEPAQPADTAEPAQPADPVRRTPLARLKTVAPVRALEILAAAVAVVGGMIGHPQYLTYTVMGTPVNLAAHLCEQARGTRSGLLICPTTYERARGTFPDGSALAALQQQGESFEVPVPA